MLVRIEKHGEKYTFDFALLHSWIELCRKNGIRYFEISHLFSHWGAGFAPNIFAFENGEKKHIFGWQVKADDESYKSFLRQFLPELLDFLHWGYNFYYSQLSQYEINPYVTSSADGIFASGDAYSVYPGRDGALKSLRAVVFRDAMQDILICRMMEEKKLIAAA